VDTANPFALDIVLTRRDLREVSRWRTFRASPARTSLWVFFSAVLVLCLALGLRRVDRLGSDWGLLVVPYAPLLALAGLHRRRWRVVGGSPRSAGQTLHYRLTDEGFSLRSRFSVVDSSWEGLHRFVETRNLFLLLPSRHAAFVLPKRCFASATQIDGLRAIAAGHRSAGR